MDDVDAASLRMPVGYTNFTKGSSYLDARLKEGEAREAMFGNLLEAAELYLKVMRSGKVSPFHAKRR